MVRHIARMIPRNMCSKIEVENELHVHTQCILPKTKLVIIVWPYQITQTKS